VPVADSVTAVPVVTVPDPAVTALAGTAPEVVRIWFFGRNMIRIHADPSYLITYNSLS